LQPRAKYLEKNFVQYKTRMQFRSGWLAFREESFAPRSRASASDLSSIQNHPEKKLALREERLTARPHAVRSDLSRTENCLAKKFAQHETRTRFRRGSLALREKNLTPHSCAPGSGLQPPANYLEKNVSTHNTRGLLCRLAIQDCDGGGDHV
jgi:hypothetical protein